MESATRQFEQSLEMAQCGSNVAPNLPLVEFSFDLIFVSY
jgi:hypothetical protein